MTSRDPKGVVTCEAVGYASDCLVTFLYKDVPMLITMKNNVEVSHGLFYH